MKLKILLLILLSIYSLNTFSQADTLTTQVNYGFSEIDEFDSTLTNYAIDVTISNIDTLNWELIHVELVAENTSQILVRKLIERSDQTAFTTLPNGDVTFTLSVLPKMDYLIFTKVRNVGGVESKIMEKQLGVY